MKTVILSGISVMVLLLTTAFSTHDFHTSTTKVDFDDQSNTVKISSKYFTEDLEKAVNVSVSNTAAYKAAVKKYVSSNFSIGINGSTASYSVIGVQDTDKATRVFIEVKGVSAIQSVSVKNAVLIGVFKDQQNFIDFKINGKSKSLICRKSKDSGTLTF